MPLVISWSEDLFPEADDGGRSVATDAKRIEVDAVVQLRHERSATLTEREVEDGVDLSEHKRPNQRRFSMEVMITNTPLGNTPDGGDQARLVTDPESGRQVFDAEFDRVGTIFELLEALVEQPVEVTVETDERQYERAQLVSMTAPVIAEDAIRFSLDGVEPRYAQTRTVENAIPLRPRGGTTDQAGQGGSSSEDTDGDTAERSVAAAVVDAVAEFTGLGG